MRLVLAMLAPLAVDLVGVLGRKPMHGRDRRYETLWFLYLLRKALKLFKV